MAAASLVLCHQGLQMLPALPELLLQDLTPPHLRPQLQAEQSIMGQEDLMVSSG